MLIKFQKMLLDSLNPNFHYGKLFEHSEVHVKEATEKIGTEYNEKSRVSRDVNSGSGTWSIFKYLPSIFSEMNEISNEEDSSIDFQAELNKYINIGPPQVFRVHDIFKIENVSQSNLFDISLQHPYNVFIHKYHLPTFFDSSKENFCKVRKVKENRQYVETTDFLREDDNTIPKEPTELIVKLICLEDYLEQCSSLVDKKYFAASFLHKCIYVSPNLKMNLNVKLGGKILLESFELEENSVSSIELFPLNDSVTSEDFQDFVKRYSKHERVLINSCAKIVMDNEKSFISKIIPDCKYAYLNVDSLMNLKLKVNSVIKNCSRDDNDLHKDGSWIKNISMR